MKKKLDYNINWSEHFQLSDDSPSGLQRKKDINGKPFRNTRFGFKHYQVSGKPHAWLVGFLDRTYLVHRIIWVMTYGSIDPELVIDHLDGDPFNNKIENLSLKTQANNNRNSKRTNSNTGITGITLMNNGSNNYYYHVRCNEVDGIRKSKYFSIDKLGDEIAKQLAIEYRMSEINRIKIDGAMYTDRHIS